MLEVDISAGTKTHFLIANDKAMLFNYGVLNDIPSGLGLIIFHHQTQAGVRVVKRYYKKGKLSNPPKFKSLQKRQRIVYRLHREGWRQITIAHLLNISQSSVSLDLKEYSRLQYSKKLDAEIKKTSQSVRNT